MKLEGAIFDLDGTLLDSMFIWDTLGVDYLVSLGKTPKPGLKEILRPMSLDQVAHMFVEEYGVALSIEEIKAGVNKMVERYYFEVVQPKTGVPEFLVWVKQRGVKTCIVTASERYVVEAALRRTGLLQYIDRIFTCEEFGKAKNEPDIFLYAQDYLGTPKEHTCVFEDIYLAIQTAKRAGFPVVAVYDETSANHSADIAAIADCYIKSFDGLDAFFMDGSEEAQC